MPTPAPAREQHSLAIVDDDHGALTALRFLLEVEGYRVQTFSSAAEFLSSAAAMPECLIVDQNMPRMSGIELAEHLRLTNPHLPMIIITATPTNQLVERARAIGIARVVETPVFGRSLIDAIRDCLANGKGKH